MQTASVPGLTKHLSTINSPKKWLLPDREVFNVLAETNAFIEARYIITGPKTFVTFEALNRTCDSLREGVGRILRENGVMIRL
jgi:hypothetical protein